MWVVNLLLDLAALYVAIIAGMYFTQTWLLFPTAIAGAGRIQLPASTQRLNVNTTDGECLSGVRILPLPRRVDGESTLLGFGGNAMNAGAMALSLHGLFPDRDIVSFHYRGYGPSSGRPSATALFSDSLSIFDHLRKAHASEPVVAIGFSIGSGIAAYLARHRPLAGLILVTPFDSLEELARDLYWWAPVGLLLRNRIPTIEFVRETSVPTALIMAKRDSIVPTRRSAPLRSATKRLVFERTIDAGHNDVYDHPEYAVAMREALSRIEAVSVEPAGR